jgi:transcriptional regulator with GAF, ATPase, and Fis domain
MLTHVLNADLIDGHRGEVLPKNLHRPPSPLARKALKEGGQLVLKINPEEMPLERLPFGDITRPSASLMFVPVRNGKAATGIISLQSYMPNAYNRQSLATLQALADHCGGALAILRSCN